MRILPSFPLILLLFAPLSAQQQEPSRKPVLIRPDKTEKKVEPGPIVPDRARAENDVTVGEFYYRRRNYKAAEDRFREAVKYGPKWSKPYEKLVEVLEKQEDFGEAIEVCKQFLDRNPGSQQADDFRTKINKLRRRAEKQKKESSG